MQIKKFKVLNDEGIHARPSTQIASLALKFKGSVVIIYENEEYDAKNVMNIMLLGLELGSEFEIRVSGENEIYEKNLLNELKDLIEIRMFK